FVPRWRCVQIWTTAMHFMVLISGFFTPIRYALLDPKDEPAFWIDSFLDVIFAVDIVMTFNLAIAKPSGLITSRIEIAKRYWWSGRLLLDVLATFPVDTVVEMITGVSRLTVGLGLLRLVRLYRLLVMFREMQQSDKTNLIVIMLAKFVTCILLSTHLSACLFWGLARDDGFVENTWVAQGAPHLPGQQWAQRYITSLFWAVGTFKAGPSSGDLVPTSDLEKMLACVVMMCNICLQTYLVSNLSALLTRADVGIYTMRHAAALKGFSMQGKQQDACVAMPGGCIRVLALPREPV
ncbi:AKT1, partial [Symbiodinium microadriaticum]